MHKYLLSKLDHEKKARIERLDLASEEIQQLRKFGIYINKVVSIFKKCANLFIIIVDGNKVVLHKKIIEGMIVVIV